MKPIVIGSYTFFGEYADYKSHDKDYIVFEDNPKDYKNFMHINIRLKGKDTFYYRTMPKEEFVEFELKHAQQLPMAAGKMLVPELCNFIGLTIDDLKKFEFAFNNMDEKHKYEKVIYDAYIENNSFTLTQEQRNKAYKIYKEARS